MADRSALQSETVRTTVAAIVAIIVLGCKPGNGIHGTVSTARAAKPAGTRASSAGVPDAEAAIARDAGGGDASTGAAGRGHTATGANHDGSSLDAGESQDAGPAAQGDADACGRGNVKVEVTPQLSYSCHQHYMAVFVVDNGSCEAITVNTIEITSMVTSGPCNPAPFTTYSISRAVPPGKSVTVLDLDANPFCCGGSGCTARLMCTEHQEFKFLTSAGTFATTGDISVDLAQGCNQACL